jgi:methylthioribose-1-phosphate isomerase
VVLSSFNDVCEAIANMTVRGAPLIGVVAAQGMAFAKQEQRDLDEAKAVLDAGTFMVVVNYFEPLSF